MLIDTHCHLDFDRFDEDRDEVVARAAATGVKSIIVPALDLQNVEAVLALAEQYPCVFAAVGIHPNSALGWQDEWIEQLRQLARHEKVVAIGEIGLDYYWDKTPKETQQQALRRQLVLAAELELPVIIHNRESDTDVLRLLAESPLTGRSRPGVLHSFSAPWETAAAALEMGYYLGFTGPVTFPKADDLRAVVEQVPADRLLIETDAPFLAPQPKRGRRNEPAFVEHVAEKIAEVRGTKRMIIEATSTENAACLFGRRLVDNG